MVSSGIKSVIHVTIAYIILYYVFLYTQSFIVWFRYFKAKATNKDKDKPVKFNAIKYDKSQGDKLSLTGDRTVGNLMEQAIPFLTSLWLCATYGSPEYASKVGWIYVITRSYYPLAFYYGLPYLLFSTIPGYLCVTALLYNVISSI